MSEIDLMLKSLSRKRQEYHHARRQVQEEWSRVKTAKRDLLAASSAQQILQQLAQEVQESAHARMASIVTRCLESVFGDDAYEFRFLFERKRGKTEAAPIFVRRGNVYRNPLRECGLGAVDVAAFALRLACLVLSRPRPRKLLVLDEPFKWVNGAEYRVCVSAVLRTLAEDLGVQIFMVTGMRELKDENTMEIVKGPSQSRQN